MFAKTMENMDLIIQFTHSYVYQYYDEKECQRNRHDSKRSHALKDFKYNDKNNSRRSDGDSSAVAFSFALFFLLIRVNFSHDFRIHRY